jgi:hypothetical protein
VTQQIGQPFALLDIRLASGHRFDVLRIDQDDRAPILHEVEHRPPEHTRTLEGHDLDPQRLQPIREQ